MTTDTEAVYASYSGLVAHRGCPQAWSYRYLDRLEQASDEPAVARDFGIWWHALRAADAIKRGRAARTLVSAPEALTTTQDGPSIPIPALASFGPADVIVAARRWWKDAATEEYRAAVIEALGESLPHRLLHLFLAWRERWAEDIANESPLGVEMWWTRTLPPGPEDPDGVPLALGGVVDEVYFDQRRKMVVVRDHKTARTLDAPGTGSLAEMHDSQLHLYAWGVEPIVREWAVGPVRAVAYDRAASPAPKPPALTKSGRLAVRGGQPSIASTDLATYLAWAAGPDGAGVPFEGLKKDGSGAGLYTAEQSVIDRLSTETERARWFQRSLTPLNRNLQALHLQAASDSAADIARTKARHARTGQAQRNLTRACSWCSFAALCRAQMVGGPDGEYPIEDYGLQRRE